MSDWLGLCFSKTKKLYIGSCAFVITWKTLDTVRKIVLSVLPVFENQLVLREEITLYSMEGGGGGGNRMASLYEYRISIAVLAGTVVRTVNGLLIDRLFVLRDYDSTFQFSHLRSLLIFSSYIVIICLPFLFFITSFLFLDFSHAYITPFPSR